VCVVVRRGRGRTAVYFGHDQNMTVSKATLHGKYKGVNPAQREKMLMLLCGAAREPCSAAGRSVQLP